MCSVIWGIEKLIIVVFQKPHKKKYQKHPYLANAQMYKMETEKVFLLLWKKDNKENNCSLWEDITEGVRQKRESEKSTLNP